MPTCSSVTAKTSGNHICKQNQLPVSKDQNAQCSIFPSTEHPALLMAEQGLSQTASPIMHQVKRAPEFLSQNIFPLIPLTIN